MTLDEALTTAMAHDPALRVPFYVQGQVAGAVARAHLPALQDIAVALQPGQSCQRPALLQVDTAAVRLDGAALDCEALLTDLNARLRRDGWISGWRDELFDLPALASGQRLLRVERAAARFWGSLCLGAHATGFVADATGRPTQVWVAQRADDKATDPGLWDNLIGGGVSAGQSPFEALVREGWEEAGLSAPTVHQARSGPVLPLLRDIPAGLQRESLHSFDVVLAPGQVPINQDGEVQRFCLLPLAEAVALAQSAQMTLDATLVMLDFAQRHGVQV
jgi:8-oxo-dGTP pyrophosphatase MutT (NUDIX family)